MYSLRHNFNLQTYTGQHAITPPPPRRLQNECTCYNCFGNYPTSRLAVYKAAKATNFKTFGGRRFKKSNSHLLANAKDLIYEACRQLSFVRYYADTNRSQ